MISSLPRARLATVPPVLAALALGLFCAPARAEVADAERGDSPLEARAETGLVIGAKAGGGIGKPASDFGATPLLELELEYLLPLGGSIGHALGLFASGQYLQPVVESDEEGPDARLAGDGSFGYRVTQSAVALSLGLILRIDVGDDLVMPYGGLGGRLVLLRSEAEGEADGRPFGQNDETRSAFGFVALGGVELFVGPGALLGELQFGWAPLDAYVLRDTNLGLLSLAVGYRIMF